MKEQPNRPQEKYSVDLSYDDDFFDLPPYEPHVDEPKPKVPPRERVDVRATAKSAATALRTFPWRKHLLTPILALLLTTIVVLVAYGAATTAPPNEGMDPEPDEPPLCNELSEAAGESAPSKA